MTLQFQQSRRRNQMSLQPVDMSTIYTQMDKIGKYNASQDSNLKLAQNMQEISKIQENTQQAKAIGKIDQNQTETAKLREDGNNSTGYDSNSGQTKQQNQQQDDEQNQKRVNVITDPLLGKHIDITR